MNEIEEEYFKLKEAMERKKEIEIKTHQYQMEMIKRKRKHHQVFSLHETTIGMSWDAREITWIRFEIDVDLEHSSFKRYSKEQLRWGRNVPLQIFSSGYPFDSMYYLISKKYKKIIGMISTEGWDHEYLIGKDLIPECKSSKIPQETHPQVKKLLREFLDSLGVDEDVSP